MLTRYSPARRPRRTWYLLTPARATRLAVALSATLSALRCACAPTVDVEVGPPHTGGWGPAAPALQWEFLFTERVDGPCDLNLPCDRYCFYSREIAVICPPAQAGLCCDMSLPRYRHSLGFRLKGGISPSAHRKTALLNLPHPWHAPYSQRNGVIWPSVQAERSSNHYTGSINSS